MAATTLVLMGRTGNGKSSTANSILGRSAFKAFLSFSSITKECKMDQRTWKNCRVLNVIDTPGLFDTNTPKEVIDKEIVKCITLAKDGVHTFLLVLSITNRYTDEEADAIDSLEILFGPRIINYMVIVFTGGDALDNMGITLEEHLENCPVNLQRLINRCNSRMIVFNNSRCASAIIKEYQITKLLEQVDSIMAANGNQPYSNELFTKAQVMASQSLHARDKEKLYAEQIKRLNEMMEQNTRSMEERMRCLTIELEKQLESARCARMEAENEAFAVRKKLDARINDLKRQLEEERKKNEALKNLPTVNPPCKRCSIL